MQKLILLLLLIYGMASFAQKPDLLPEVRNKMKKFQYSQAIELSNTLISNDSMNFEAYLLKALSLKELLNYSEALTTLKKGLCRDTTNVSFLSEIASLYSLTGENQKAFETYSKLALMDPDNSFFVLQMANTLYAANSFQTAKKLYLDLIHNDSLNTWYLRQAGLCYTELRMTDSAIWYFDKTLSLNNYDLLALSKLSNLYLNKKDYTAGLQLTETLRQKDSTRKEINKLSAYFFYLLRQYDPAIERFRQYLSQCKPNEPEKFGNKYLGLSLYKTENFRDAIQCFQQAYLADSADAEVCFYLGVSNCRSLYSSEGIKYLNKTLDLILPSSGYLAKIYAEIGDAYNNQDDHLKALEYITKSHQVDSTDPDWLFKLAYQYDYYLDDLKTALAYYQQHISITAEKETKTEEMSYLDFSRKRVKEIPKGVSISNYGKNYK